MELDDVCDASYGQRLQHYLNEYGGKDSALRAAAREEAHRAATIEMLDEIHVMLRRLVWAK